MARTVRCGLIQTRNVLGPDRDLAAIKKAMIDRHVTLIGEAARKKVKILCLQELFYGPYFCAEQEARWYHLTERVPDGPTITTNSRSAIVKLTSSTACVSPKYFFRLTVSRRFM